MTQAAILIVEDEAIVAADLAGKLTRMGYAVAGTAARASESVEMARRLRPDLVLMDIQLAGPRDGISAAREIRDEFNIPVIYLTAHSDAATVFRAKSTEAFGYILKPLDQRDLETQIEMGLFRHRAEMQLYESRERYRSLFHDNPAALLLIDPESGGIVDANPAACAYYGYTYHDLTGMDITRINSVSSDRLWEEIQAVVTRRRSHLFFKHRLAGGQIRDVEVYSAPITIEGRRLLYFIIHDITDRKQAEEALLQLNNNLEHLVAERTRLAETRAEHLETLAVELVQTEERERQRIADMLHDDLQQLLVCARMHIETVCRKVPSEPLLSKIEGILMEAIGKSRNLSHELSSVMTQHMNLNEGIEWLVHRMKSQFGLAVHCELQPARPLDNELLTAFFFRALRELLFNVVKHAGVKSARLSLRESAPLLVAEISDRGKGFDPAVIDSGESGAGISLMSFRQRARYIGGDLVVESTPGEGSRFTLMLPIRMDRHGTPDRRPPRGGESDA